MPPGRTSRESAANEARGSGVWCSTPLQITTSKPSLRSPGARTSVSTNRAPPTPNRSAAPRASSSDARLRSAPTTTRSALARNRLSCPVPQPGQARRSSKDGIEERGQRLHRGADDQDQSRRAEEDEQRREPLAAGTAAPQATRSIDDGRRRVRKHEPGSRQPAPTANHATSGSASAARRLDTRASPATRRSMPLRRNVE